MLLLLRKLYLYFTNDSEGSIIFQGVFIFFRGAGGGPNANFPYTHLLFSNGGVQTRTPLWIRTWAMSS